VRRFSSHDLFGLRQIFQSRLRPAALRSFNGSISVPLDQMLRIVGGTWRSRYADSGVDIHPRGQSRQVHEQITRSPRHVVRSDFRVVCASFADLVPDVIPTEANTRSLFP